MKTKLNGILTLLLALVVQVAFAQQTVTGKVTDTEGGLFGAVVSVKGGSANTTTDFDGNYSIQANPEDTLVFTYSGYDQVMVLVGNQTVIDTVMKTSLDQVVVIGYRTTTAVKSSVASSIVTDKTIKNRPNANILQTLSGQVAGLNINTTSGQPGGDSTINLRGIGSINGNTEPLFIIDGAFVDEDNFRSLNPQDIKTISVLRDAAATAIYGNRGANGVVVIETSQGSYDSPLEVSFNSLTTFTQLQDNDYGMMNSQQLLTLERERGAGFGAGVYQGTGTALTDAEIAAAGTNDWREDFFRTGVTQNNTVSLSSGGKNSRQFTSFGYFDQEGILVQSRLKRFNLRTNVSGRTENDKFNYKLNLTANYSDSQEPNSIGSGAINRNYVLAGFQGVPWLSANDYSTGADLLSPLLFANTPLFLLDRLQTYNRKVEEVKIVGSLNLNYKITDDISLNSTSGIDYQNAVLTRAEGSRSFNALLFGGGANPTAGFQQGSTVREFTFNQTTSLNYNKVFAEKHSLNVGLYTEYFKAHLRGFNYFAEGLDPRTFAFGDGSGFVSDQPTNDFFVDSIGADNNNSGLFSYFGSIDYSYDDKYGITGTIRRDASSRFEGENKWGSFYAVSAFWNIHKEDFFGEDSDINFLKLRGSYGEVGNQYVNLGNNFGIFGPSAQFTDLGLFRDTFGTGAGYAGLQTVGVSNFGLSGLRWETTKEFNVGLDFEAFESRLRGSLDMYYRDTTDLFTNTNISAIAGTNGYTLPGNFGILTNKGIDLSVNYDVIRKTEKGGFALTVGGVANINKNIIRDLNTDDSNAIIGTGREGNRVGEYFTIRYAGVNPANGNVLFLDANGDLTENPNPDTDRVWLNKDLFPEFTGSFNVNMEYKDFYLNTQWNFATGLDRFDNDLSSVQDPTSIGQFNVSTDLLDAWTPTNRNTAIPSLDATNINTFNSTRYLQSADYLNLRFVTVGYNFDKEVLSKLGVSRLNVFLNAENILTFSKWRGYDPLAQTNGSRGFPTPVQFSIGLELGI
ncbi:SusC/RagA family TonB-linked outer membrane protein [uncultured Nonlabens sp.]|uniref:SusC/RagA family TonB-linked outer membrane protein n=1 Tax=uncultured Nonlabens sp. TaxID=859306 RepID=UPI0030DD010E|tara:strand:- start:71190 stop:74246 length:3057 start_codon:yes stop_codon:yes gene_type:complete